MDKPTKLPNGETRQDYKLVAFADGDPENPKNWSKAWKWYITMVVAATCFVVAFCSSVITADVEGLAEEFHVSHEAALVTISVFVVGFGVGEYLPYTTLLGDGVRLRGGLGGLLTRVVLQDL